MKQQNERCYDLPLLFSSSHQSKRQCQRSKDMPQQLKNDLYRMNSKQNILKLDQAHVLRDRVNFDDNKLFQSKQVESKNSNKKSQSHLRQIIRRKLKASQNSYAGGVQSKPKEKDKSIERYNGNRYKQILKQFYGEPSSKGYGKKQNEKREDMKLVRHQSAKSLRPKQNQLQMQRMRSQSCLKSPANCPSNHYPVPSSSSKPTYLDLYMQKRRPVLFL